MALFPLYYTRTGPQVRIDVSIAQCSTSTRKDATQRASVRFSKPHHSASACACTLV